MNNILKLKITTKKSSLESVRQIIRQKPAKASDVRQPKKVDCKMIGKGAKSITVVRSSKFESNSVQWSVSSWHCLTDISLSLHCYDSSYSHASLIAV
jgi:hypothetical protein